MLKWFKALPEWLEFKSGVELCALFNCILKKMLECSDGGNVGQTKQLKQKLQEHYNYTHIFVNVDGYEDIVCFRSVVEYIINEKLQFL